VQLDRNAPVEKELLPFVQKGDRWIVDQFPEVFSVGKAGAQRGKKDYILDDIGRRAGKKDIARQCCSCWQHNRRVCRDMIGYSIAVINI